MRIHRLEVAGFGPFRTAQTVDFDHFIDDGIFLITGKTGAGKSSILDAICFALYDAVPASSTPFVSRCTMLYRAMTARRPDCAATTPHRKTAVTSRSNSRPEAIVTG